MHQARPQPSKSPQRVIFPESVSFPKSWKWFMDQSLPQWVKGRYSPRESWKNKPFAREDAQFFFRGIEELSELFTQERGRALQRYFEHPRFRSSYLLYFLPLQAAKFIAVFNRHEKFLLQSLKDSRGGFRVVDLGAGPCTASIALLLWLLDRVPAEQDFPKIEITAVDTQGIILSDGIDLVQLIADSFPRTRGRIQAKTERKSWQDWARQGSDASSTRFDLALLGHLLNEGRDRQLDSWLELLAQSGSGGLLAIEPASKGASQGLSSLRDEVLATTSPRAPTDSEDEENDGLPSEISSSKLAAPPSIVGPCPHAGNCPLAEGPDWCHFSFPAQVPGEWFTHFSKGLGSERQWLKFSYLWMTPKLVAPSQLPLLISDSLTKRGGRQETSRAPTVEALVCRPEHTEKVLLHIPLERFRGPLGLRGGWLATGKETTSRTTPSPSRITPRKKDSAGPPKGASRKGRPGRKGIVGRK